MARRVLITGACGFVGSWIIRRLLDDGDQPIASDLRLEDQRWSMVLSREEIAGLAFHAMAIDDTEGLRALVHRLAPHAIIHLAGLQVPACRANPLAGARVNVLGSLNLFEAVRSLPSPRPPIVYASSAAVLGPDADHPEQMVDDRSAAHPTTHYGAFKLCIEHCARAYALEHGLVSVGLRPLTVYGPGRDTGITSFPTRAIAAAVLGERFTIPFSGPTAYVHVREVADIVVRCARQPSAGASIYTIGGDVLRTAEFIAALAGVIPGARDLIDCTPGDLPVVARLDDGALRREFPGLMRLPIGAGIAETVQVFTRLKADGRLVV